MINYAKEAKSYHKCRINTKNKLKCIAKKMIIAIFKNKANIRRNRTNLNSQQVKQSENHVGLCSEEHRESVP